MDTPKQGAAQASAQTTPEKPKKARKPKAKRVPALRLCLGGAPATPHVLAGVPGFYQPDKPTPVGGPGECSVKSARELAADEGAPVELVEITAAKAEKRRAELESVRQESQKAAAAARRSGQEPERVNDEIAAASGEEA